MKIKKREKTPQEQEAIYTKDFFDSILPSAIKFFTDYYIFGNSYRCVWAVREYPPTTEEQAIFSHLAEKNGVSLRIYNRPVEPSEQRRIVQNANRKNKMKKTSNDLNETVDAECNLQDVVSLIVQLRKNREVLIHCAVYMELKAESLEKLREFQSDIMMEITRCKLSVDRLTLRQKEGFLSVMPIGSNVFGPEFERVLPSSSVANLFPFSFSGKTDPHGIYIGRDKYGTNILVDPDKREDDKTNSNILILGNSGQGKSYLMKLLLTNIRESGKSVIVLDPESEYEELCESLGGSYIDCLSGENVINPLEPKMLAGDDENEEGILSQHISFLKDFFRAYKEFDDDEIDTLEILLQKLYESFDMINHPENTKVPLMSDLYKLANDEYMAFDKKKKTLYSEETLRGVCLGIHSMCVGAESRYFNGFTNIKDDKFLVFGVKGLLDTNKKLKDALLFNILSFMSNKLLREGNCCASIDELYLFLTNMTAIEYIRNAMKRVRKKDSSIIVASQNIEDFLIPEIREYTKPLFSIPSHQFLFNPGQINHKEYIDALSLENAEFELVKYPERGTCLYRCGNERYLLQVKAPAYKEKLFGSAGGR